MMSADASPIKFPASLHYSLLRILRTLPRCLLYLLLSVQ